MKNAKLFGIIVLVAIIGFSMMGCPRSAGSVLEPEPTVTSVTVSPATATVERGGGQDFTAMVQGTNTPPTTVTWAVEGGVAGTAISTYGRLTLAADETAIVLMVRATSTFDISRSGVAIVTVTDTAPQSIANAVITVTTPVRGETPNTTASGTGDFTIGAVSWSPAHHSPFQGGTEYTATVMLTANTNFTFASGLTGIVSINGYPVTPTIAADGGAATLSHTFAPTDPEAVVPGDTLAEWLAWLRGNAQSGNYYYIEINGDENITPVQAALPTEISKVTITIRGIGGMRTVSLSDTGSLFTIGYGVTLVLGNNITLEGKGANDSPLVFVTEDGTLVMEEGSVITGNTNASLWGGGGGVRVDGTFTMTGGEISGNSTTSSWAEGAGGGVRVESGGRFDMRSGTISGNTGQAGGGVHVQSGGTFRMCSGVIYGNEVALEVALRNTSSVTGSASLSNAGTAQRGTFHDNGNFILLGNLISTSDTIWLVNGLGRPTGVTVSPAVVSAPRGGTQVFTSLVTGLFTLQTVSWSIVEFGTHAQTTVTDGVLSIAAEESLARLTVRATSTLDDSVYGEAIVTVTDPDPGVAGLNISFADFQDMAPAITGPTVYITGDLVQIVVLDPHLYTSIRWFHRGNPIAEGPSLTLDSSIHNNMVGTHSVTVEVGKGTALYSAIITFRVMP